MGMGFLGWHRARRAAGPEVRPAGDPVERDRAMAELFAECGLLRELARDTGVRLDDTVESLTALDQLLPLWREDPAVSEWLGTDAGLYLGAVLHRAVPGAQWRIGEGERPVLVLPTGAEVDVTALGRGWAEQGSPQLASAYLALVDG